MAKRGCYKKKRKVEYAYEGRKRTIEEVCRGISFVFVEKENSDMCKCIQVVNTTEGQSQMELL